MIAYFLLVHRYPEQFKRMFRAIYAPGNVYIVHVDRSSGAELAEDVADFLQPYQGAEVLPSRRVLWGGYSLVDAELRGMTRLLEKDLNWKYFINLSGQDFPLKSQGYIRRFLAGHVDTQFMRHEDQRLARPETMNRVSRVFIEAFQRIFRTGLKRKFLPDAKPYIGTQWKIVSRRFCEYVCHDPKADRFKRFYQRSFIADEGFFQTVMMNGFRKGAIINNDMRSIDWIPDGDIKLRPRVFTAQDARRLMQSPDLFARKFDSNEDAEILDILEHHISTLPEIGHPEIVLVDPLWAAPPKAVIPPHVIDIPSALPPVLAAA
ncbi:MAG: beta-1,6-N-acetylglucosaminyltransferase [Bosea sp. (in: a-proteobacteria)]